MLILVLLCLVLWPHIVASQPTLAFPSAEGFGRYSMGGRGGKAYNINSLSAATGSGGTCNAGGCSGGEITYRDCLTDRFGVGARTCIFTVSGTIDFGYQPTNSLVIPPYLTIAGQTAPGSGIMIRGMELSLYGTDGGAGRGAHDVIIRHIRMRNRFYGSTAQCNVELISSVFAVYNIIVDHVSIGWNWRSAWGAGYNAKGITYQRSLLSEGLFGAFGCASPAGAEVSAGGLFSSAGAGTSPLGDGHTSGVSFLHNYTVHYDDRVPFNTDSSLVQAVNNVVYNTRSGSFVQTTSSAGSPMEPIVEYINNYFQHGPQAQDSVLPRVLLGAGLTNQPPTDQRARDSWIYLSGNYHNVLRPLLTQPETDFVTFYDWGDPAHAVHLQVRSTRYSGMPVIASTVTAAQARQEVLDRKVGAYGLLPQGLDAIDQRAIRALQNNSGGVFNTTSTATLCSDAECGETGVYPAGTPYTDTDGDGIADSWEIAHGLNPNDPADGPALTADGYSNLEHYLNELAGDTPALPLLPPQLLVHWRFDDGTGTTAQDATGHGTTGTLVASPPWSPGRVGPTSLQFDGATQYVTNGTLSWPAGQPVTVSLWVNTPGGTQGGAFTVGRSAERFGAHIPWSDNVLYWDYGASLTTGRLSTNFAPYLGRWTHVVLVSNGSTFKAIYLNGQLATSGAAALAPQAALTGLDVGRYVVGTAPAAWHQGAIDDFRLSTYVLSATEIAQLYQAAVSLRRHNDLSLK